MPNSNLIIFRQCKLVLFFKLIRDMLFCLILIGFWWIIKDILGYFQIQLVLDNDSIKLETGILNKQSRDILFGNINMVEVKQSLFARIFNYGDLVITTGGDKPEIEIRNLPDPNKIAEIINSHLK
jgi:uncharacterized membrane protein YdbT with pleckstrin-like domain